MKRRLLVMVLLLGTGLAAYAQTNDDIFPSSSPQNQQGANNGRSNTGNGNDQAYDNGFNQNNGQQYADQNSDQDQYIDYEDDNYYASHINRFYYPYSNMGYYSSFYNPYWYDPFWVDPLWGYNPWFRPRFGISIGFGPYWTGAWGWNSWYGYSGFGSCWGYPIYAGGYYGGYYGGFWNGYYAGVYNGYGRSTGVRNINYGPRVTSLNTVGYHGGLVRTQGFSQVYNGNRSTAGTYGQTQRLGEVRQMQNGGTSNSLSPVFRGGSVQSQTNVRSQGQQNAAQASRNIQGNQQSASQPSSARRGGFFNNIFGGNRQTAQNQGQQRSGFNGGNSNNVSRQGFQGGASRSGFFGGGNRGGGAPRSSGGGFGGHSSVGGHSSGGNGSGHAHTGHR